MNMNKVYLSGRVSDNPGLVNQEGRAAHLMFLLCVQHKTQRGAVKQELYSVNAWNNTALWGGKNLRQGQSVGIQGYLTQHIRENGMVTVEITAEEFLPGPRMMARAEAMPPRVEKRPATADVVTADTEVASEYEAASAHS